MGVKALKNPLDTWIYQEILNEVKPEAIIELGNAYGGGTLFLAHMLDLIGSNGVVIGVDHSHEAFAAEHERITTITGDTRDSEVLANVGMLCEGKRTIVIHDASHDAEVVLEDLRNYAQFVSPGSYLIVEDGVGDVIPVRKGGRATPGPLVASEQFLREREDFELDLSRERYVLTYNPRGFLRRRL
jgi:cephalosporin hydroxylase